MRRILLWHTIERIIFQQIIATYIPPSHCKLKNFSLSANKIFIKGEFKVGIEKKERFRTYFFRKGRDFFETCVETDCRSTAVSCADFIPSQNQSGGKNFARSEDRAIVIYEGSR